MKCSKCGVELSENSKFCSYCGQKVEESEKANSKTSVSENVVETLHKTGESIAEQNAVYNETKNIGNKESLMNKVKNRFSAYWNKSSVFEKIASISIVLFILMCLIAFLCGKTFAGIIAVVQIALTVVALLMKKQIIKVPKSWIHILAIALSFVLLVPYIAVFRVNTNNNAETLNWADIILCDIIPEPDSHICEIYSNSDKHLSLYILNTSSTQYINYVDACIEKGFTVEAEQSSGAYDAYSQDGYKLALDYYESKNEMSINVDAPEELGTLEWSDSEMAKLIPVPKSKVGKIEKDDETGFSAYIGETSIDDYREYVRLCYEKGFTVDESNGEKNFSAKNSEGYTLTVEYKGNSLIYITISEPEYQINIEVNCDENLIFSKYDIDVYVDDFSEGTIEHGETETFTVALKRGTHKIRFVNEEDNSVDGEEKIDISQDETFKFEIYCTSSQINIENVSEANIKENPTEFTEIETQVETAEPESNIASKTESIEEENLTVDNCPELAAILKNKAEIDESYSAFASKYAGRTIEFDGRIDYCTKHGDYNTRFDYLVSAGDYDPDHQIGPTFKFEDVSYYDLNTDLDTVSVGLNVHIVAEVESFDNNSGLFFLDPVAVTER